MENTTMMTVITKAEHEQNRHEAGLADLSKLIEAPAKQPKARKEKDPAVEAARAAEREAAAAERAAKQYTRRLNHLIAMRRYRCEQARGAVARAKRSGAWTATHGLKDVWCGFEPSWTTGAAWVIVKPEAAEQN